MKEIGSEFWLTKENLEPTNLKTPYCLNLGVESKLLLSGRTAIDLVLRDIQENKEIYNVYFPAYCCQSMLQPFIDHGVNVIFYDVNYDDGLKFDINENQQCDIFFAMNYFGFSRGRMDSYIRIFKQRNITVIEDSTHSLLSESPYNNQSDYIVASLRKWFPIISGGLAVNTRKQFVIKQINEMSEEMIEIRKSAMLHKGRYMNGIKSIEKRVLLERYSIANEMLQNDYILYGIDKDSYNILQKIDLDFVVNRRKRNARVLYDSLKENYNFKLFFSDLDNGDCPLFIPIVFKSSTERDSLRRYLIDHSVYCPIHWPRPAMLIEEDKTNIYDYELSLLADQRYGDTDMQYIIRRLDEFYD